MSPPPNSPLVPSLGVLLALMVQNVGAAVAKSLFPLVGVEGMTALRVGLSAVILIAVCRPWRGHRLRAGGLDVLVYGFSLGLMNLLIYSAFQYIPIGIAVAIEVTGPLAVVLFSSRRAVDFLWLALTVAGLSLLLPIEQASAALDPRGLALAFGSAACWAVYIVFGKRLSARLPSGEAVALGMAVAALLTVPIGIGAAGTLLFAPHVLALGAAVALLSSVLPYLVEMAALARLPRKVFGILVSSAPAIAALAGFAVLGERLTLTQWLAIACVMAASAGSTAFSARPRS
ncbi:EamA family transporter [Xanthobacteraceae bacterium Astr-EGSB]|uniref:EamA family transporter n=1 Tax=Astrobacterium formosum TaxID=3069710 RepID=UPI0027B0544E|nr:EamA family transporter [Xanthobacteraceae bacterium Astr-EGSB]